MHDVDEDGKPPVDDRLKWYLLPDDIEDVTAEDMLTCPHADVVDEPPTVPEGEEMWRDLAEHDGQVAEIVRRAAMLKRREYSIPSDLLPQETPFSDRHRHMEMQSAAEAREEALKERIHSEDVPLPVRDWVEYQESKVERMLDVLTFIEQREMQTLRDLQDATGFSSGSLSGYLTTESELVECVDGHGDDVAYTVTDVGTRVLDVDWSFVLTGTRAD